MDQTGNEMLEQILSILESYNYCRVTSCVNCQKWQKIDGMVFQGHCMEWNKLTHYDQFCSEAWGRPDERQAD